MKNTFVAILIALTIGTSSSSFASAVKTIDNGQKEKAGSITVAAYKSKVDVFVQHTENPRTVIRIMDPSGRTIATKDLSNIDRDTRVSFDLSQLPDGLYAVKVWDGQNSQETGIELKTTPPVEAQQEVVIL